MTPAVTAAFILLASVFVLREYSAFRDSRPGKYIFTPAVTLLIIVIFILTSDGAAGYKFFIFLALMFSLVADVLLMIEETDLMLYGIVFFVFAHISYIIYFSVGYTFALWNVLPALFLIIYAFFLFKKAKDSAGRFLYPMLIYFCILSCMIFFAVARSGTSPCMSYFSVAGAICFLVSDSIIAFNLFIRPLKHASVLTWLFYAPAQLFFSLS